MKKISMLIAMIVCAGLLSGGVFAAPMTKSSTGEGKVVKKVHIKRVKKVIIVKKVAKGAVTPETTAK